MNNDTLWQIEQKSMRNLIYFFFTSDMPIEILKKKKQKKNFVVNTTGKIDFIILINLKKGNKDIFVKLEVER